MYSPDNQPIFKSTTEAIVQHLDHKVAATEFCN